MKLIVIAAGIVLTGILFPACSPGGEETPKSKIMEWIIHYSMRQLTYAAMR